MNVCIYCSSHEDIDPRYKEIAAEVAREIALRGDNIVFGGIRRGLMRIVAEVGQLNGARVTGIIPSTKRDLALSTGCDSNDENIYVPGLNERKAAMIESSDEFVVLPGGYGTLDELLSTLATLGFEGITHKRILVYNADGLYDSTIAQLRVMVERKLLKAGILDMLTFIDC